MYSVCTKLRNKKLESVLHALEWDDNEIGMHDSFDIEFQSTDLALATKHYNTIIQRDPRAQWKLINKRIIKSPLNEEFDEGFINCEYVLTEWYN
jgi:hypothetical protein